MSQHTPSSRQERERRFHDSYYAETSGRAGEDRFYQVTSASTASCMRSITDAAENADCIEYGCGSGDVTLEIARYARTVVGFDVSSAAISRARKAASSSSTLAKVSFEALEAEALPFTDSCFDLAFGIAVLHHLELTPALREMRRILRPDGKAVFCEPLGHNPIINWYRRRTPHSRTPDERPLLRSDLRTLRAQFASVNFRFFHLASLASVVFEGRPGFTTTQRILDRLDHVILAPRSPLRSWSWICVLECQGPLK